MVAGRCWGWGVGGTVHNKADGRGEVIDFTRMTPKFPFQGQTN